MKGDTTLFRFQLSSELLGQEMDFIINATEIMQFANIQEISANYVTVYMKSSKLNTFIFVFFFVQIVD